jgi:hypothetical protein
MIAMIITDHDIRSHRAQAKRFWTAHTYSGFCLLTRSFHKNEKGEYFGQTDTLSKKSAKNTGTII